MVERPSWLSKIPTWWPVAVGLLIVILALAETRWRVQHLWDVKQAEQAANEKLQWDGIAGLNKQVTKLEEWVKNYEDRLSDDTFQDWVSDRARKTAQILQLKEDTENLEARIERIERRP